MTAPIVVHVNNPEGFDRYIGRAVPRARDTRAHHCSPYCNPIRITSTRSRADALRSFDSWVRTSDDPEAVWIRERIHELSGERIACWCADVEGELTVDDPTICHGQVLAHLYEELVA